MPDYAKNIVYLSQAQYAELIANQSITVDNVTVTYNENDIYVTPQAEPVTDVQINGTSIAQNGTANIPIASSSTFGAVKINGRGLEIGIGGTGVIGITPAQEPNIKAANLTFAPITPITQHLSAFYGLAKAAGDTTQAASDNAVGTYTTNASAAIRNMIGAVGDVQINGTSIVSNGVANIPPASSATSGIVKIVSDSGLRIDNSNNIRTNTASVTTIKAGTNTYAPIAPSNQDAAAFYGLAKVAGDTTQSQSDNAVGTYTNEAKAAIKSMIGVNVDDVQVNGTSVITNGVANVPIASTLVPGVVKYSNSAAIVLDGNNCLKLSSASSGEIKQGVSAVRPFVVANQHEAVFYGLAKAASDTTQSQSSNAVGQYTDNAKASIKSMLGIVDGSTGTVEVTGTTPTITAVENTRYVCGEVATLSFTPPASGISIVRFTSGTTATVITLPNTVIFPEWFDATSLEANTIYEICITDGIYGAVMSWAQ